MRSAHVRDAISSSAINSPAERTTRVSADLRRSRLLSIGHTAAVREAEAFPFAGLFSGRIAS
jgi:hypothetical protein